MRCSCFGLNMFCWKMRKQCGSFGVHTCLLRMRRKSCPAKNDAMVGVIAVCRSCRVVRGANSHQALVTLLKELTPTQQNLVSGIVLCPVKCSTVLRPALQKKNIIHHFSVFPRHPRQLKCCKLDPKQTPMLITKRRPLNIAGIRHVQLSHPKPQSCKLFALGASAASGSHFWGS